MSACSIFTVNLSFITCIAAQYDANIPEIIHLGLLIFSYSNERQIIAVIKTRVEKKNQFSSISLFTFSKKSL